MLWKKRVLVHEKIGEGLNAEIYRASLYQPELKSYHEIALKVLKRKEDLNHFKMEYSNILKTSGRRLVSFRGFHKYKGRPALLLELINGVTLKELYSQTPLTEEELNYVVEEVQFGLVELKDSGVFHGDLSPQNIMITQSGDIKLIDFGLTKWRTQKIETTPEFAAPKVFAGDAPDYESDLYSLDKLHEKLLLRSSSKPYQDSFSSPKNSLAKKVYEIMTFPKEKTESYALFPKTKVSSTKTRKKVIFPLFFLTLISCYSPSLSNTLLQNVSIQFRSDFWISLTATPLRDWCFTPCTFIFDQPGPQKILWKTAGDRGYFYINAVEKETFIQLQKEGLSTSQKKPKNNILSQN